MSTYSCWTKHPETGLWENALWIDDYFAHYHYGVQFPSDSHKVYDPYELCLGLNTRIDEEDARALNEYYNKKQESKVEENGEISKE